MAGFNKVLLMGNLVRDAELRYIPSGAAVLEFRIAVSRTYRNAAGEDKDETCFIDVNLWGKRGEAVAQFLTKGKQILVEGRLQYDEWEDKQDGQKRSKHRVSAENIEFVGRRDDMNGNGGGGPAMGAGAPAGRDMRPSYARDGQGQGQGGPVRPDFRPDPRPDPYARSPAGAAPVNGGNGGGGTGAGGGGGLDDVPF